MSRIAGLNDLKEKKEDEAKKNEYFAGGVDNRGGGSGLAVEGPPSGRRPNPSSRGDDPFEAIVRQAQNAERPAEPGPAGTNNITIALYRNGFVVNDGPLRDLTSPESKAFLAALERGDLPPELRSTTHPGVVDVQLMDKRQQDYVPPPQPAYVAYSGDGARIGSASSSDAFLFSSDILSDIPSLSVDESQPTTTVQVKTHNGKKLRIKINQSDNVLQLAAHIYSSGGEAATFTLMAGFPPKDIVDPTQTISEANLIGASIVQKLV